MILTSRRSFALLSILASALALGAGSACSKKALPEKPKLTFALDWVPEPEFGGFYAAKTRGDFDKEGLDVTLRGGGAGAPVVQLVASGEAQFGITGADDLLAARAKGIDVVPIYAVFQTYPHGIMVHADKGYKTLADALQSGKLAIEPGARYATFLQRKYGRFGAQVVPYDGGVARFLVDPDLSQQCFVTAEPLDAKKRGSNPKVFMLADEGYDPYAGVVFVKRSTLTEHPDQVAAFVRAAREGWKAYLADPAPANKAMHALNTSMDEGTFSAISEAQRPLLESTDTQARGLGSMSRERWDALGHQLADMGVLDKTPKVEDVLVKLP